MKIKAWKIRNIETGEFSSGGTSAWRIWTKGGKTWTNIGHIKSHLTAWIDHNEGYRRDYPYHNAEIIEVEIDLDDCFAYPVSDLVNEMKEKKAEKAKKEDEIYKKWVERQERKKLEELKKKYEG